MPFRTYVGVDQTGAAVRGVPRPLPAAKLVRTRRGLVLETATLRSASRSDLLAFADDAAPALVLDAVLGMPAACVPLADASELWELLARAHEVDGYGRAASEAFFARWASREDLPRRPCDVLAKATSILATRPFQKNVQTGTFRVWKDLTREGSGWANVWPFDPPRRAPGRPWLFEGYPSLLWRLLGFPRRAPERLAEVLPGAPEVGPDLADAIVLALGASRLDDRGALFAPWPTFRAEAKWAEGWIVGLAPRPHVLR